MRPRRNLATRYSMNAWRGANVAVHQVELETETRGAGTGDDVQHVISWEPQAGPQEQAYHTVADETLYGGQAGGGKTDLLLGMALTHPEHRNSIVFRRERTQMVGKDGIMTRAKRIVGLAGRLVTSPVPEFRGLPEGRALEFGSVPHVGKLDAYQGRAHDLKLFDELAQFPEQYYRYLIQWTRSTLPGVRPRIVSATNPPLDVEGEWVIQYWAPWLDPEHEDPALPGELRWFVVVGGNDVELPNRGDERPDPVEMEDPVTGAVEAYEPASRTFIPASLDDNAYLRDTGYRRRLHNAPEPMRSLLLRGFDAMKGVYADHAWQVIPSEWIKAAQERWEKDGRPRDGQRNPMPLSALGVDVARGGTDRTVLQPRFGAWFDEPQVVEGVLSKDGVEVATAVMAYLFAEPGTGGPSMPGPVGIDAISVGASAFDVLKYSDVLVVPIVSSAGTGDETDAAGLLKFRNLRALMWWRLREALDPSNANPLALPPSRRLRIELAAPRFKVTVGGILVEAKEDIKKRIGRSPDLADALVYAHHTTHTEYQLITGVGQRRGQGLDGFA